MGNNQFISTDTAGKLVTVPIANPAIGNDIIVVVPANRTWLPLSFNARIDTSAIVATRTIRLYMSDGINIMVEAANTQTVSANSTRFFRCYPNVDPTVNLASLAIITTVMPYPFLLTPSRIFGTNTNNLDAGDQYSVITLTVKEFITPSQ